MFKKSFLKKSKNATSIKIPKPEVKPERSLDEIKAEYSRVCGLAGEEQFKMKTAEAMLFNLNKQLAGLHQEYTAAEARDGKPQGITSPAAQNLEELQRGAI